MMLKRFIVTLSFYDLTQLIRVAKTKKLGDPSRCFEIFLCSLFCSSCWCSKLLVVQVEVLGLATSVVTLGRSDCLVDADVSAHGLAHFQLSSFRFLFLLFSFR